MTEQEESMTAHSASPDHPAGRKLYQAACILIIVVLVAVFPAASSADNDEPDWTRLENDRSIVAGPALSDLIARAQRDNPAIAAARLSWRAAVEDYRVASNFPDPRLSASYPTETRIGDEEWQIALSQPLPLPGQLDAQGEAATADIHLARLTYEKTVRDQTIEVRQSAHELIYLQQAIAIAAGNRDLLDQLMASGRAAYARERTSLIDLSRAAAQSGQLQYDEQLLAELARTERTRLNALLNRAPDAAIGTLVPPLFSPITHSLDELYRLVEENGVDVLLARAELEKAEREVTLARYRTLPEVDVALFVNSIAEADPLTDNGRTGIKAVGATVSLSLPIWIDKNQGRMTASRTRVEQAKAEVTKRVNEARAAVSRLFFRVGNAARLIALYRDELMPEAAKSLETAETWFREGKGSLSDFTETRTVWYTFQLAMARSQADYGQNLAALEGLIGRDLTTAGSQTPPVSTDTKEVK